MDWACHTIRRTAENSHRRKSRREKTKRKEEEDDVGWHQAGSDIPRHEKSSAEQGGVEATYTCRTCLRAEHLMMMYGNATYWMMSLLAVKMPCSHQTQSRLYNMIECKVFARISKVSFDSMCAGYVHLLCMIDRASNTAIKIAFSVLNLKYKIGRKGLLLNNCFL